MFHYTCFQEDVNREMIIVTISDLCNGGGGPAAVGIAPGEGPVLRSEGRGSRRGISESSFKNGVFLTVPVYRYFASVAELLDQRLRRLLSSSDFSRLRH